MIRGLEVWVAAACIGSLPMGAAAQAQPKAQQVTDTLKLKLVERSNTSLADASTQESHAGPGGSGPVGSLLGGFLGGIAGALMGSRQGTGPTGLLVSSPDTSMSALPTLWVSGLQPQDRTICIEIRSADGQEYADGSAALPEGKAIARQIRLDYDPPPTRLAGRIRGSAKSAPWKANEFVVRARVSRTAGCAKAMAYLPVSFGQMPQTPPTITLLVNAGGPTATLEAGLDTAPRLEACRRMGAADNGLVRGYVTYTHSCRMPVSADLCGTDLQMRIDRETGSGRTRGDPFFVRAPCTP